MLSISRILFEDFEGNDSQISDEDVLKDDNKTQEIQSAIIKLFLDKKLRPDDDDVHALAAQFNMDAHEFEEVLYALLGDLIRGVGKHKQDPSSKYDSEQLKMGMDVEKSTR